MCDECDAATDSYYMIVNSTYIVCAQATANTGGTPCTFSSAIYPDLATAVGTTSNFVMSPWGSYLGQYNWCADRVFYSDQCLSYVNLTALSIDWADTNAMYPVFNFTAIRDDIAQNSVQAFCQICQLGTYQQLQLFNPFTAYGSTINPIQFYTVTCKTTNPTGCDMYSFQNSAGNCQACQTQFDNCLACNSTQCTVCPLGYYWNPQVWDYRTNSYKGKCEFQACPAGYCLDLFGYTCVASTYTNCQRCQDQVGCLECKAGYMQTTVGGNPIGGCTARSSQIDTRDRFVRVMNSDEYLSTQPLNTDSGFTIGTEAFSIHKVLGDLYTDINAGSYSGADFNIYLEKGVHFLILCTGDDLEVALNETYPELMYFCDQLNLYRQYAPIDNINITVQPLYCSLKTSLGYSGSAAFDSVCVDLTMDSAPIIMVNGPYSYFNITGTWTFIDLIFDGTNSIVSDPESEVDFSIIPAQMCQVTTTPTGYDGILQVSSLTVPDTTIAFSCQDSYQPSAFPSDPYYKCVETQTLDLMPTVESSLACARTYDETDYFFQNKNGVYSLRQRTLFNLYAFASYQSVYPLVPTLNIINCTFQYFYGQFDSLINIEPGTLTQTTFNGNQFFIYTGRQSGGNITLSGSTVQHSRFCRGMIYYRRLTYEVDYSMSLVNHTLLYDVLDYSVFPYVKYQSIVIDSTTVYNANSFKSVKALANYGGSQQYAVINDNTYQPVMLVQPINVGIVMNLESYTGAVIIQNSIFDKNMHYLAEYNNTITFDSERQAAANFLEQFDTYTSEYKLAMCEDYLGQSYAFWGHAFFQSEQVEMEDYYDFFERLSMIYISRQENMVYINNNTFTNNIGTFGGAISINTPLWKKAINVPPQITITANNFTSNMAYISGNAVYIRTAKNTTDYTGQCSSGIYLEDNYFGYNIGTKLHNGGAVSIVCTYLDYNEVFETTSAISTANSTYWATVTIDDLLVFGFDRNVLSAPLTLSLNQLSLLSNTFEYNFAGKNGSAIFISQPTSVNVYDNLFQYNSAVFSTVEEVYSPFYKYLSQGIPFTFYDQIYNFTDEFDFMINKDYIMDGNSPIHVGFTGNLAQYKIEYPQILGAIAIYFCQQDYCLANMVETATFNQSNWFHNDIGQVMIDNYDYDTASCVFVQGGLNITFYQCNLSQNSGPPERTQYFAGTVNATQNISNLLNDQVSLSQSSMIVIYITDPVMTTNLTQYVYFVQCTFYNNTHFQFYDTPADYTQTSTMYVGQLIRMQTNYQYSVNNFIAYFIMHDCVVLNNTFYGQNTSQIYVAYAIAQIYDNNFQGNGILQAYPTKYQDYGVIYIAAQAGYQGNWQDNQIMRNYFRFNMGYTSAGIYMSVKGQVVQMHDNIYTYQISNSYGSALTIYEWQTYSNSFFNFTNETFTYNFGTSIYFYTAYDGNVTQGFMVMRNSLFKNLNANQQYSFAIYAENYYAMFLINNTFIQNITTVRVNSTYSYQLVNSSNWTDYFNVTQAAVLNDSFKVPKFTPQFVINTYFTNNLQTYIYTFNQGYQNWNFWMSWYGWQSLSLINIITSVFNYANSYSQGASVGWQQANIYNCIFGVQILNQGILNAASSNIYFYSPQFTLARSNDRQFQNQTVINQGTITLSSGSYFWGENMVFQNNTGWNTTASMLSIDNSNFYLTNGLFFNNIYTNSPMIQVTGDSYYVCYYCNYTNNYAYQGIIYGRGKIQGNFDIENTQFVNNKGDQYLIYFSSCSVTLSYSNFLNSDSNQIIIISDATLVFQFNNVTYDTNTNNMILIATGFFYAAYNSDLTIKYSSFQNVNGTQSAVLYASEGSTITMSQVSIQNCHAGQLGGVVYFLGVNSATITTCTFMLNSDVDIMLDNSQLTVQYTTFQNGSNSFINAQKSQLFVSQSSFNFLKNKTGQGNSVQGGGIYCSCQALRIQNCQFNWNNAYQGGAIYITTYQNATFTVTNNNFTYNSAIQGGAIYLSDAQVINISNNYFFNNTASRGNQPSQVAGLALGGALYLDCYNLDVQLQGNCIIYVTRNSFIMNYAQDQGGGLLWVTQGNFTCTYNYFDMTNWAPYGQSYGSYPHNINVTFYLDGTPQSYGGLGRLLYDDPSDYFIPAIQDSNMLKQRLLQDANSTFDNNTLQFNIVSGQPFNFTVTLIDHWGQQCLSDNQSKSLITTYQNTTKNSSITFKNNQQSATNGLYNFTNVIIIATPDSAFKVQLQFIQVSSFNNNFTATTNLTNINVYSRRCVPGEEYTQDGRCQVCPVNQYSIVDPITFTFCKDCPSSGANCTGGAFIVPLEGYQRSMFTYDSFVQCPIYQNCLPGNNTLEGINGSCAIGYKQNGIVCAECDYGFSLVKEFQCKACPDKIRNIVQIAFIILIGIIVVVLLVRSTLSSSTKIKPAYSVYLKIMANHFQILSAISNIDYQWPDVIQNYYDVQTNVATASQQLYSFDCILNQDGNDSDFFPVFFQKLVLIGSIPILATVASLTFWAIYFFIQRRRGGDPQNFLSKFVSTLVVLLFLLHPDIAKYMFLDFNCQKFDGINRLKYNIKSVCYQGTHLFFTVSIVIPSVILWVFGIPLLAIFIMMRYKQSIKKMQTLDNEFEIEKARDSVQRMQMFYGFLFNGYSAERFYWETVIILRKVFIIMGAVFFSSVSSESQILVALLIVLLSLILQNSLKPYYSETLNRMEILSLTVAAFTMYTGMYYVTGSHYDYMNNPAIQYILLIALAIPNIVFMLYWLYHMRIEVLKELYKKKWYSFITILQLKKFEEQVFYEKYLKGDEAFEVIEDKGSKMIKYVGIELHFQLSRFVSMRSSEFHTSFNSTKQTLKSKKFGKDKKSKKTKGGTVAIRPDSNSDYDDTKKTFNSTMKFNQDNTVGIGPQDETDLDVKSKSSKQPQQQRRRQRRIEDTFEKELEDERVSSIENISLEDDRTDGDMSARRSKRSKKSHMDKEIEKLKIKRQERKEKKQLTQKDSWEKTLEKKKDKFEKSSERQEKKKEKKGKHKQQPTGLSEIFSD